MSVCVWQVRVRHVGIRRRQSVNLKIGPRSSTEMWSNNKKKTGTTYSKRSSAIPERATRIIWSRRNRKPTGPRPTCVDLIALERYSRRRCNIFDRVWFTITFPNERIWKKSLRHSNSVALCCYILDRRDKIDFFIDMLEVR